MGGGCVVTVVRCARWGAEGCCSQGGGVNGAATSGVYPRSRRDGRPRSGGRRRVGGGGWEAAGERQRVRGSGWEVSGVRNKAGGRV